MRRKTLFLALAAMLAALVMCSKVQAWGGYHYSYHYVPAGPRYHYTYHYGHPIEGYPYGYYRRY